MKNPLHTLDEVIWEQFGKVTNAAYNSLGWTKYDLGQVTSCLQGMAFTVYGIYLTIYGAVTNDVPSLLVGPPSIGAGYAFYLNDRKKIARRHDNELTDLVRRGVSHQPTFGMFRPAILAISAYTFYKGVSITLGKYKMPESIAHSTSSLGLLMAAAGVSFALHVATDYILDQPTPPPTQKKSIRSALREYVSRRSRRAGPAEQPVSHYVPLPQFVSGAPHG